RGCPVVGLVMVGNLPGAATKWPQRKQGCGVPTGITEDMTSPATDAAYPHPADKPRPAVFIHGPAATMAGLLAAPLDEPASPAFYAGTVISALALVAAWVLGEDHRVIDPARWPAHALRGSWP